MPVATRLLVAAGLAAALSTPAWAGQGADTLLRHLYGGTLAAGMAELEPLAAAGDGEARFGIGMLQMASGLEHMGQNLYRYGAAAPDTLGFAVLFLPVPANPNPEHLTYDGFRSVLQQFVDDVDAARGSFLMAADVGEFTIPIDVLEIRIDLDGDGSGSEAERLGSLFPDDAPITGRPLTPAGDGTAGGKPRTKGGPAPAQPVYTESTLGFDTADAVWLAGYSQVLAIQFDFLLAHDFSEMFNAVFHRFFPRAGLPMQDSRSLGGLFLDAASDPVIADAIAAIHTLSWPVAEPERLAGLLERAHQVTALSRRNWDLIMAETDDFRELVPSPRQTSLIPEARVTDEIVAAWRETLDRVDDVLDGTLLIPHWRFAGQGVDLNAYLTSATRTDLVLMLTGSGMLPYLKTGPVADAEAFRAATRAFGEDWMNYAFWFN
jgi:hypothetical protein